MLKTKNDLKHSVVILCLFGLVVYGQAQAAKKYIRLHVGSVEALDIGEVERVAVGNDEILASTVLENGELLLIPKGPGETDLHIWKPGERKVVYRVRILQENIFNKKSLIESILSSYQNIKIRYKDDYIIVEGDVLPEEFEQYEAVVKSIPNVITLVKPAYFKMDKMVKIHVQVLEIDKNYKKDLGIKWDQSMHGPIFGIASNIITNDQFALVPQDDNDIDWVNALSGESVDDHFFHPFLGFTSSLLSRIQLLEENGVGRTLAEPTLVTRSSTPASFHSGGEYPVVFFDEGDPRVEFKQYGIILEVEPIVDDKNNIMVKISTEVSSIDLSTIVNNVPGLLTRSTDSVVNVRNAETIVISGLLSIFDSANLSKVPYLGDIPVLGNLFKSKASDESRTELLVLVTPEIVTTDGRNNQPGALMLRHMEELQGIKEGYIDDELLE